MQMIKPYQIFRWLGLKREHRGNCVSCAEHIKRAETAEAQRDRLAQRNKSLSVVIKDMRQELARLQAMLDQ